MSSGEQSSKSGPRVSPRNAYSLFATSFTAITVILACSNRPEADRRRSTCGPGHTKEIIMTTSTIDTNHAVQPELAPLLKIEDLEQIFRVDRKTISRWCKKGQIPAPLKLGGSRRWQAEDIARVLERKPEQEVLVSQEQSEVKAVESTAEGMADKPARKDR
jgi:predicted DNA-binding transcriptional regulator AlpA